MSIGKDHRVELDRYSGPLDLLLYLVREEEVDVHDIPIARILDRYLEALEQVELLDIDQAGEFLVMASVLMRLKSRSLLPRGEEDPLEDEELDPRFELVRQLLEYRKFRDVALELRAREEEWSQRRPPGGRLELPGIPPDEVPIADVSVWDLASAFSRLLSEVGSRAPREIVYDDVPIETHIKSIAERLEREGRVPFRDLFPEKATRSRIAGVFIALLELVRQRRARAVQEHPFGPIHVVRPPEPPDA